MSDDTPRTVLRVHGVGLSFGSRSVLSDVTFDVRPGEFTGLIGSNGVGKTTLLRIILGLQRPDQGSIDILEQSPKKSLRSVGFVPQKVVLDPDVPLRARDFVALGIRSRRLGWQKMTPEDRDLVESTLVAVDASSFANERVGHLSGGEQQRILIAHALVGRPALLVLDEPLANLDPHSAQEIVALLHRVAHEHHVAVLLSAHEMNPLLPVMDRIGYITNGRAASGTTDEVVRTEVLSRLYGHHVDVVTLHGRVFVIAEPGHGTSDIPDHPSLTVGDP